uniref:Uncharacterized protein n=1 Tax=viral metagenome TaxID=1070528 RepID=A0A6C0HB04_9ZZZZ
MPGTNKESIWGNRITKIGFTIIIFIIVINIIFQIMKYFDIDISSIIVYITFAIFMAICYFVLPKDIPMSLVLPKTPIPSAPEFTDL